MGPVELLRQLADDGGAGGVGEQRELAEMLAGRVPVRRALERSADEYDALLLRGEGYQVAGDERTSCVVGGPTGSAERARYRPPSVENRPVVL